MPAVPSLVGDDLVGAQKMEPTDTTAADGSGNDTRTPRPRPLNCPYGEVTAPDGTLHCRARKRRTYRSTNGVYQPVAEDLENCNAGEAIISTWPDR